MDLKAHIRAVPDFPKPGILFRDITPLLAHPEAMAAAIDQLVKASEGLGVDRIVGIESRGFLFGVPLAQRLGVGFVPLRKAGKLPGPGLKQRSYDLEYGQATLEIQPLGLQGARRVLIVDDLLATGGTARAAAELCEDCGVEVASLAFLIELVGLGGRDQLGDRPLITLIRYGGEDDSPQ